MGLSNLPLQVFFSKISQKTHNSQQLALPVELVLGALSTSMIAAELGCSRLMVVVPGTL